MNNTGFRYRVEATVVLTQQEVFDLIDVGKKHYDYTCRAACKPAEVVAGRIVPDTGFIYGIKNQLIRPEGGYNDEVEVTLTSRELDLICKILETAGWAGQPERAKDLVIPMRMVLSAVIAESDKLNSGQSLGEKRK